MDSFTSTGRFYRLEFYQYDTDGGYMRVAPAFEGSDDFFYRITDAADSIRLQHFISLGHTTVLQVNADSDDAERNFVSNVQDIAARLVAAPDEIANWILLLLSCSDNNRRGQHFVLAHPEIN